MSSSPAEVIPASRAGVIAARLAALRVELVEQAYALERQGRLDAADTAIGASVRLGELCDELAADRDGAGGPEVR